MAGVEMMLVMLMAGDMDVVGMAAATSPSIVTVTIATSVTVSIFVMRARRCARACAWIPKLVARNGRPTAIKEIRSEARILGEMLLSSELEGAWLWFGAAVIGSSVLTGEVLQGEMKGASW
jgi:hypothetical protein